MLYARDVGRSARFYSEVLGFDFKGWWSEEQKAYVKDWELAGEPGYAELSAGPLRLSLHGSEEEVPSGGCIFHLRVQDVDAFHRQIVGKGAASTAPKDEPWGWRMILVEDPDGHQWGFYTS